jgi:uncharacterized membrane protein
MTPTSEPPNNIKDLWGPEAQFSAWLSASFLLLTASLLFYHMTRVQSLEMGPRVAGFFSVSLILIAVTLTVLALWTYFVRVTELLEDNNRPLTSAERNEKKFKFVYLVTGILIVLIEVSLCVVVVSGSTVK